MLKKSNLKSIKLVNFQAYEEATFEFPEFGTTIIEGPNGHGKSVIVRAISLSLSTPSWHKKSYRHGYIREGCFSSDLQFTFWNGTVIKIHIAREAKDSYYKFNDEVCLYVHKDKDTISSKVQELGLNSLAVQRSDHLIPFVTRNASEDCDSIYSLMVDKYAEVVLENAQKTMDKVKEEKITVNNEIAYLEGQKSRIQIEDDSLLVIHQVNVDYYLDLMNKLPDIIIDLQPIPIPSTIDTKLGIELDKLQSINLSKLSMPEIPDVTDIKLHSLQLQSIPMLTEHSESLLKELPERLIGLEKLQLLRRIRLPKVCTSISPKNLASDIEYLNNTLKEFELLEKEEICPLCGGDLK